MLPLLACLTGEGWLNTLVRKYPELIETLVLSHTGLLGRKDAERRHPEIEYTGPDSAAIPAQAVS